MARGPRFAVLIAFIAVSALAVPFVAGPAVAVDSGEDAVTLPATIPINSDTAVQDYEQDGVVTEGVGAPQMSITIGTDRDHVGLTTTLDPLEGSTRNDFIRVNHKEDIGRTVQIPIRADYWKPYPRERLESLSSDHTASMEPVQMDGRQYTMLTVTFDGDGKAVFPIPEDAIAVYSASENTEDRVNTTFGIDLGITPSPWSQIPGSVFGNKTAVRIEGDSEKMMIQYNDGTKDNPNWLVVPDEQKSTVPVYRMEKEGVNGAVYVVSQTNETPSIRYKAESTWGDKASVYLREARNLPGRIADGFGVDLPDVDLPFMTVGVPGARWL